MPAFFGLDIGTYSIKVVQLTGGTNNYRLSAFGEARTPVNLKSLTQFDKRSLANCIAKLVNEARINIKEVYLSLSETMVYSEVVELPYLSENELSSAINFEAEQYIPIPIEEVQLEYLLLSPVVKDSSQKKIEVLLVAGQKQGISQLTEISQLAGLIPTVMETEVLSLIRIANLSYRGNCIILDLGHATSKIIVLQNRSLKLLRILNIAGEAFTRAVGKELKMAFLQAEQYKAAYGLNEAVLEGKVAKAIEPVFNLIINEIKNGLNFIYQKQPDFNVRTILVSGGGALMPGLNSYLAKNLNLEAATLDPFRILLKDNSLKKISHYPGFATAVGLAARED